MNHRANGRRDGNCTVFAVVFDSNDNGRMILGRSRMQDHAGLLKQAALESLFQSLPSNFVMGRIRCFECLGAVVADTGSDLFTGKKGVTDPLAMLPHARLNRFEQILCSTFPGYRVFLLQGGLARRVPSLSLSTLRRVLKARERLAASEQQCPLREITRA